MKVAAYQAPLLAPGCTDALVIRAKVEWCETQGVTILCRPEAILGGLADYLELAKLMAARGATALFVPTNNALPLKRADADLTAQARKCDIATAIENGM